MHTMKKIVCLGGGSGGTSTLLRGLKNYPAHITSVSSMADDGGSSGRLRKAYDIMPPGNLISCIAALVPDTHADLVGLLMHRFPGSSRRPEPGDRTRRRSSCNTRTRP